jgi:hypothetical protein
MAEERENVQFRKQKNNQNLNEKSRVLKLAFATHNRHYSNGLIKEILNSKSKAKKERLINQSLDLAKLSQNLLKGEELTSFIKRSFDLIK